MNSLLDERQGSLTPAILCLPSGGGNLAAADDALELGEAYDVYGGHPPAESQRTAVRAIMAQRDGGGWAAKTGAYFGPRQGTGKTDTLNNVKLDHVLVEGTQLIIYSAHQFDTTNETFLRFVAVLENHDDLRKKVTRVRTANGMQAVEFSSGQRVLYRARTGGGGRGYTKAGLTIYDEAQHMRPEHVAASGPARLANPNSQSIYAGSGGLSHSSVAWGLRRAAVLGTASRLALVEHTAESFRVDGGKIRWTHPEEFIDCVIAAMPGLGRWVTIEDVMALADELGEAALRELACVWDAEPGEAGDGPILLDQWHRLTDGESLPAQAVRLALDAPPDRMSADFAIAGRRADNVMHVDLRRHVSPNEMGQLVVLAKELTEGHGTPLILPPNSPARAWKAELLAGGVELDELSPAEYAEGCGLISSKVAEGSLRHRGQPEMTAAIAGLAVRTSGDVDVWSRRNSSVNIAPFVAATCALVRVPQVLVTAGNFYDLDEFGADDDWEG